MSRANECPLTLTIAAPTRALSLPLGDGGPTPHFLFSAPLLADLPHYCHTTGVGRASAHPAMRCVRPSPSSGRWAHSCRGVSRVALCECEGSSRSAPTRTRSLLAVACGTALRLLGMARRVHAWLVMLMLMLRCPPPFMSSKHLVPHRAHWTDIGTGKAISRFQAQ